MSDYEDQLVRVIFPDLLRGRENFDLPHTQAVVHWMKEIVKGEPNLDEKVMITAAYAHDWGYIDLHLGKTSSLSQVHDAKELHMQVGAVRIRQFLTNDLGQIYTKQQIERISHLVYVHDRLKEVKDDDEIALVEADTLGALDTDLVIPTFSKADNDVYIKDQVLALRRPLFRHSVALKNFDRLLKKRIDFYRTDAG